MFNWLFKSKPKPRPKSKPNLDVGRYYVFKDCPFIEDVTVAKVMDIREGWVKYKFWHKHHGVMNDVTIEEVDNFCSTFKFDVTGFIEEYEANK